MADRIASAAGSEIGIQCSDTTPCGTHQLVGGQGMSAGPLRERIPQAPESQYKYDIFLSYRRANAWPRFVDRIFLPMLRHWLQAEMGRPPHIFFDAEELETGESWPHRLAIGVALSKIMICLWSNEYFYSPWCQAELAHMLARRESTRIASGPLPLVLAVVIHDGDSISPALKDIQQLPIQDYANPWLAPYSPRIEELSEHIRRFSVHVHHALQRVPECDPAWENLAVNEFVQLFAHRTRQHGRPSLGQVAS
jgi:TIR domain